GSSRSRTTAWSPSARTRRAPRRAPRSGPWPESVPDREHRLEVVPGEDLEGHHRLRPRHTRHGHEPRGDKLGQLLVARDAHDRDEVPLAGHRERLADPLQVGELAAERGHRVPLGLDEHDRGGHGVWVSPGWSTTTSL